MVRSTFKEFLLDYFHRKCRIAVMTERDRQSHEFQMAFREDLKKYAPEILLKIELLEANGLAVVGYARSTDDDIVLEVGFPPDGNGRLKEIFDLRVNPYTLPLKWDFEPVADVDELSPELREKVLHQ